MTGGWAGSNRRATLPKDWPKRRLRILKRDGYRCTEVENGQRCPNRATDVHHHGDANDHSDPNLRSICSPHHDKHSSAEGNRARWAHPRRRPADPHPGLKPPA